jgi:hypothetical protein
VLAQHRADGELEQRLAAGHQVAHRGVAVALAQLAGVLAVRGDGHEGLRGEGLVAVEGLERGGLPGRVAVEGVDDLAQVERVVPDQPADHRDVLAAERRAAGRDRGRHPGQVHGHHVGVALDHHHLAALGDLPLGQVEPEQHLGLAVDRRVGAVEVLGLDAVVVEDPPGAEPDDLAAQVADRPQQPAVEPVDRAAPALLGQPGLDQLVHAEPGGQQVLGQHVPAGRGVPAAEPGGRGGVEAAAGQEPQRGRRLGGAQLLGVELGGPLVGVQQPGAGAAVALDRTAAALVGQPVAEPVGQPLHGLHEPDDLDLLHERERVAALAAAEAVEGAVRGAHVERRRLLVVERAQALQRPGAGPAQGHVLADQLVDPGAVPDLGDVAVPDPPCHGPSLCRAPAAGPRRGGAGGGEGQQGGHGGHQEQDHHAHGGRGDGEQTGQHGHHDAPPTGAPPRSRVGGCRAS